MKSFSSEEINELINNKDNFKQAIIDSKGFVLYLADKYTIDLSVDLLIDTITPYSIRFISEHMKSHKYSPEQNSIVISYLKEDDDSDEQVDKITEYSLSDLLHDIKEEKNLPSNANDLLSISFDDFLQHQSSFVKLIYSGGDDFWGANEFYSSHFLLSPLFKKLTKEQFLQIDKKTFDSCPALFDMSKHLMQDDDIRILFNSAVQEYYKHPTRISGGYKPKLESYRNYHFKKHEKELFLLLLKNDYRSDYDSIKNYKGFNHFFTKNDYILNHNIAGIQYFSEKEIADNLVDIRKGILAAYFSSHYINLERIYTLNISKDSFNDIFTSEFVEKIITSSNEFHFHYFDRDYERKTENMNKIHKLVLTLCSEKLELLNIVGLTNCVNNITSIIEHNRSYFDETYQAAAQKILTHFDSALTTSTLFSTTDKDVDCFGEYDIHQYIFPNMIGKESINYLFALIKIHDVTKNWKQKTFTEEIDRIIPLLNSDDVKTIAKMLNYKIDTRLLKNNPKQNFEDNFLNFTPDIVKNMNFSTFNSIFKISKEFRTFILKNDFDYLITDHKINNPENKYSDFIGGILNSIKSNESTYFSFMKSFIKKNKDFMLKYYFKNLVAHPIREELITINTDLLEKDSYSKIESIIHDFSEKLLEYERNYAQRDKLSKKEKKKCDSLIKNLETQKSAFVKDITEHFVNISFDFYSKKINESSAIKAIQLYNASQNNDSEYLFLVFDKIESLDFSTTKDLINNQQFLSFLFKNKYDSSTSSGQQKRSALLNKNFTPEQNIEIVETLLKNFNNPDLFLAQYESKISLSKILHFINKENRFKISNDLAVKHDMLSLFNSYDYLPKSDSYFEKHVKERFTNKQILQAIDNLNAQGLKIISSSDQNLSHDNLLSYNFKYQAPEDKKKKNDETFANPYLNDYLDLLKSLEKDPLNYLACIHADIIGNFTEDKKWGTIDLAKSAFYNQYINEDIVIEAMKEIFSLHKEMTDDKDTYEYQYYKGIAMKNALKSISHFISYTYSSYQDTKSSEFDEHKSKKILKFIIKEAPQLFFSTSSIGKILDTNQEFSTNFFDYYHKDLINDFFVSSAKTEIMSEHFSLDYTKKSSYWQSTSADSFITETIKNLTETRDSVNIYKLDFIIKEHKFNDQRPYHKNLREFNSPLVEFLSHQEYEHLLAKSLGYIKMIQLTDRLDSKPRMKVKSSKI